MFEGNLEEGELEIGQVAALIDAILPAEEIVGEIVADYNATLARLKQLGTFNI